MRVRLVLALALLLPLALALCQPIAGASGTPEQAQGDPARIRINFRPEGPLAANETYSVWPANTSELPEEGMIWTFSCTDGPYEYEGFEFYAGGIAWVTAPLAGDLHVSGKIRVVVWLNSTDQAGFMTGCGAVVADIDEDGELVAYWHSDPKTGPLPPGPTKFVFEVDVGDHVFEAGHIISFGVGVATTRQGYRVSAAFGGGPWPARAEVPVLNHVRVASVSVICPDGTNRTKIAAGEAPLVFNISVTDPLGNLDVASVCVRLYNESRALFQAEAEAVTNRTLFEAWYVASWEAPELAPGNYTLEVVATDNSGNTDNRTLALLVVSVGITNLSYSPGELKLGVEQRLTVSFTNNGTDSLFNVTVSVVEPDGLVFVPDEVRLGELKPGQVGLATFTVLAPLELGTGTRRPVIRIAYADFRGTTHERSVALELKLVKLGTQLKFVELPSNATCLSDVRVVVQLLDELGRPIAGATVKLLLDGREVAELTTGPDGKAEATVRLEVPAGKHTLKAVFAGSDALEGCETTAELSVRKLSTSLSPSCPSEVEEGKPIMVMAKLVDELGRPIAGAEIAIYVRKGEEWELLAKATTDGSGTAVFGLTLDRGEHALKVVYEGDEYREGCEAEFSVTVKAREQPAGIPMAGPPSTIAIGAAAAAAAVGIAVFLAKKKLLGRP